MNCNKLKSLIRAALKEDIGTRDITTELVIPEDKFIKAVLLAKENFVLCGLDIAKEVFRQQEAGIKFRPLVKEGSSVKKGRILARIEGKARAIFTAERVALNFLGLLSGIATTTREYVTAARPYRVKIMDTRKTIPGLRQLEKYAVRIGGGYNHRMRLDEMVLVKDNHIKAIGDRLWVMGFREAKDKIPSNIKVEIEVKTLKEFKKALNLRPDIVMLDNMSIAVIRKAVQLRNRLSPNTYHLTPKLEASGGITLKNVRKVASTGVDMISIGALTHSVKTADTSLEALK